MQTFRLTTNTEGVDLKSLSYQEFCTRDGLMQQTAREIDAFGYDARSEDPFLPNAAILRSAEAVDAVLNAARSGEAGRSSTESAGFILCSITQLGGVLYVLFVLVIATVLLSFLPVVNFFFMLCFDTAAAGVAITTGNPKLETNASASGGRNAVSDKLLSGVSSLAGAAQRNKLKLPRRRGRRTSANSNESESLLQAARENGSARHGGLLMQQQQLPTGAGVSPPTPPITPEGIDVRVERYEDAYQNLSRYGVRVEHGVPL
jgi:hypothetical protein